MTLMNDRIVKTGHWKAENSTFEGQNSTFDRKNSIFDEKRRRTKARCYDTAVSLFDPHRVLN